MTAFNRGMQPGRVNLRDLLKSRTKPAVNRLEKRAPAPMKKLADIASSKVEPVKVQIPAGAEPGALTEAVMERLHDEALQATIKKVLATGGTQLYAGVTGGGKR